MYGTGTVTPDGDIALPSPPPPFSQTADTTFSVMRLGDEHPDTLATASNLAYTLCDQGKLAEAEALY